MSDAPLNEQQVAARGRELETSRWRLPARYELQAELLALSPEELKAKNPGMFALYQRTLADEKRLRESAASGATMSSQDAFRARAAQRAEEHRATITSLDRQIADVAFGGVEGNLDELQSAKIAIRHRMAEQLAVLGRFDLAASAEPDPVFRDRYMALLDAVFRDDSEWCGCGDLQGSGEHSHISVTRQHISEEVFSIKHAKVMPVIRCSGCGGLNVMDAPKHLLQQRAHRVRARQIAGDLPPTEAAARLTAKGHTTEKLIAKK